MAAVNIKSFQRVAPMIYAYSTPGIPYHEGWTKIGYTENQTVPQRIRQQTHTAGIRWNLEWQDNAMYKDGSGEYFTDHAFHDYLQAEKRVKREPGTEWFEVDGPTSQGYFLSFAQRASGQGADALTYTLREEQARAVRMTKDYFDRGGEEFLWNAKPRFGKTLSAYDLIRQMGCTRVLIVTNRPSIANSWAEDFRKFVGWRGELCFVSEKDSLKGKTGVMTRDAYISSTFNSGDGMRGMVAFESLQGLKGSKYFGGNYDKLKWMTEIEFDLLIIDEAQEGVDTFKTEKAFRYIKRNHTLYLSGTAFKQLASDQFKDEQIFNWTYADEQEAKANWAGEDYNPYEALPRLSMLTYQLSNMIYDRVRKGLDLSGEEGKVDYAFDLNEFFLTNESGEFVHKEDVVKFLHALSTQEKYPFSTPELREELKHTVWMLNRVASCKALKKLLKQDPVFGEYEVVLAAGDGRSEEDDDEAAKEQAYDRVRSAIENHGKTITLTVGQLTVGITIPEWSAILMLCNLKSPSSYMQAVFRSQNPYIYTKDGQRYRKETAYVFDFDPARTLIIFDEFANNLSKKTVGGRGTSEERRENIKRLLNFFPVLGEDDEGKMVELDAAQVLSIPRKLKSQEVVRRGFMSNFLFQNISNIFGAPAVVQAIVEKMTPAQEEPPLKGRDALEDIESVPVNQDGEVDIPEEIVIGKAQDLFGEKVYETIATDIFEDLEAVKTVTTPTQADSKLESLISSIKSSVKKAVIDPIADDYELKRSTQKRLEKQIDTDIERKLEAPLDDYKQQTSVAKSELERKVQEAASDQEVKAAKAEYQAAMQEALEAFTGAVEKTTTQIVAEKPQEIVGNMEEVKAQEEKETVEDAVRKHLRGFCRTIPSFIMAYGDADLCLANFDAYVEAPVFLDVTSITLDEFRFLRDGGDWTNEQTGETEHFEGQLFDETVFNDSIKEFLKKREELADYFDEGQDEDIFDYIPPQKTNQIFTPRWVVQKMVDELEENNPGCFDDPDKTFADLYMKSGLYITEIVKRLYKSEKLKALFPDDKERIRHILQKQVYGMAPTRIIYLIATNYILGFDPELKAETHNFVEADAAKAAKQGKLGELVDTHFS